MDLDALSLLKIITPLLGAAAGTAALLTEFRKDGKITGPGKWALAGVAVSAALTVAITMISGERATVSANEQAETLKTITNQATEASTRSNDAAELSETAVAQLANQIEISSAILESARSAASAAHASLEKSEEIRAQTLRNLFPLRRLELSFVADLNLRSPEWSNYLRKLENARLSGPYEPYSLLSGIRKWFPNPPPTGAVAGNKSTPPSRIYFFENSPAFPSVRDGDFIEQMGLFDVEVKFYREDSPKTISELRNYDGLSAPDLKVKFLRKAEDRFHMAIRYDSNAQTVELVAHSLVREHLDPAWDSHGTIVSLPDLRDSLMVVEVIEKAGVKYSHFHLRVDQALQLDSRNELRAFTLQGQSRSDYKLYAFRFPDTDSLAQWAAQRERKEAEAKVTAARIAQSKYRDGLCYPKGTITIGIPRGYELIEAVRACRRDLQESRVPKHAVWKESEGKGNWRWDHREDGELMFQCLCERRWSGSQELGGW